MSKREEYNQCMVPYMKGGGPDRKLRFCIGAKLCSGKSKSEEEAKAICLLPKEPKPIKARRSKDGAKSCEKEVRELTQCVVGKIDMNLAHNINSIEVAIVNAIMECKCQPQK